MCRQFPTATRLDGHGKTLLPGLIDAHGHVIELGFDSVQIQLVGSTSLADAQARIRAYARANPDRAWLLGGGWNQVLWGLGRFPVARELDASVADRPVVLDRIDGHAKWLNTKALATAGITRTTADPTGGRIERDSEGLPTVVLIDKAMDLIKPFVPQPSEAERLAALRAALTHMNAVGLTGVGDAGVPAATVAFYKRLADEGVSASACKR